VTASRGLAAALAAEALVGALFGAVMIDVKLHDRLLPFGGVNMRGYRGPLRVSDRRPGEHRFLMVGDASAFGFGVAMEESFPSYLARTLWIRGGHTTDLYSVTMINAAAVPDGAYAFRYTVRDFARFHPDIAVIHGGYDGLCDGCPANRAVWRRQSAVYRTTGYWPILPQYLEEKGAALREDPSRVRAGAGHVLWTLGAVTHALDRVSGPVDPVATDASCGSRWAEYCGAIAAAVDEALRYAATVVVMTPPYASDVHRDQQRTLASMIERRYGADRRVRYIDAGDAVDLQDRSLTLGDHLLSARGNKTLADKVVPQLLPLVTE